MYSLQEAFIHPLEPCEAPFITDMRALYYVFWTVEQKHLPTAMIELRRAGLFLYNSDLISLKEESHTHLGCLNGE